MSHGITGYNGRVNLYRQLEQLSETSQPNKAAESQKTASTSKAAKAASLGTDLSESESRMIRNYFPESEQMQLRLYGPGRTAETVNPNAIGQRLDLRG